MAIIETRWVTPLDSQSIWNKPDIPLQTSDLIPDWMDFVWVLPGRLDERKLCIALAQTLRDYYHAVARLKFDDKSNQWRLIFKENIGVPLTFGSTMRPSVISQAFDHEKHPDYVDKHPFVLDRGPDESAEKPLLTLKVVEGNCQTTLTLGWCHILGDAWYDQGDCTSMTHLANALSLYYQGIQPTFTPTFEKYSEPDPSVEETVIPEVLPLLYHQEYALQNSSLPTLFSNMLSTTSRISVRISGSEVRAIHTWVSNNSKVSRISEADTVVGILSSCIASVSPVRVEKIAYILGTRVLRPSLSLNTMGNCMQTITTEMVEGDGAPWDFADALRNSMNSVHDPEIMRRIVGLHSQMLRRPEFTPDYINMHSPNRMVYVNALHKIPVLKVDFGFSNRVRFYLYGSGEHFLSMLPANPTLEADGTWTTNAGGIDVVFRLKNDRVDGFWKNFHALVQVAQKTPGASASET